MAIIISGPKGDRQVPAGKVFRLAPGERVSGNTDGLRVDVLDDIGKATSIGVGDLLNRITTETGFKRWWQKMHKGECMPCQKRQAAANYFKFKGPQWLHSWVEGTPDKDKGE